MSDKTCKVPGKTIARFCKIMHYPSRKNALFLHEISASCKNLERNIWFKEILASLTTVTLLTVHDKSVLINLSLGCVDGCFSRFVGFFLEIVSVLN